jgi:hypothetical protein
VQKRASEKQKRVTFLEVEGRGAEQSLLMFKEFSAAFSAAVRTAEDLSVISLRNAD